MTGYAQHERELIEAIRKARGEGAGLCARCAEIITTIEDVTENGKPLSGSDLELSKEAIAAITAGKPTNLIVGSIAWDKTKEGHCWWEKAHRHAEKGCNCVEQT